MVACCIYSQPRSSHLAGLPLPLSTPALVLYIHELFSPIYLTLRETRSFVYCLSNPADVLPLPELPTAKETCDPLLRRVSYLLNRHIVSANLSLRYRRTGRLEWHCAPTLGQEAGYAHSAHPTSTAGLSSFHSFQGYLLPPPSCTGKRGQCPFQLGVHQALPRHMAQGLLHLNNPKL